MPEQDTRQESQMSIITILKGSHILRKYEIFIVRDHRWFNGLVVMISVSHLDTEGLQFDPGLNHLFIQNAFYSPSS